MSTPIRTGLITLPARPRRAIHLAFKIGLIAYALIAATVANAEQLGRLFFTPAQRAQLEYGRQQNDNTPDNSRSLTVSGIVQKHGGERTVWINGVPQAAGKSDERAPESLPVAVPGQPQPVKVKVGQKVRINPTGMAGGHP